MFRRKRKMTNGDLIRKMTNTELADFLTQPESLDVCQYCDYGYSEGRCQAPARFACTKGYVSALMERWLDSEI